VPYTVLLAALAALLEFIPIIGPLAAAIVITVVAAVSGINILPVLIFIAVYRVFQDYVLSPHVMGQGVEMHPLFVLFGVFAGAEIAGVPGAFLSVPVLALLRVIYIRARKSRVSAELAPAPTP
jgi:predicted PurR-regulated permease PerM